MKAYYMYVAQNASYDISITNINRELFFVCLFITLGQVILGFGGYFVAPWGQSLIVIEPAKLGP